MGSQRAPRGPWAPLADGVRSARISGAGQAVSASPVAQIQTAVDEALTSVAGETDENHKIDLFTLASAGPQDLTLTYLPSAESWNMSLNGIAALWGTDYDISGQTLSLLTPLDPRTDDLVEIQYDYLTGLPATPDAEASVLFTWNFNNAPSAISAGTSGAVPWTVANGSYAGSSVSRNGPTVPTWQSDCHAHKTVTAQTVLSCGVAVRSSDSVAPVHFTDDTDGDDFGLLSLCSSSGATCRFYLGWSSNSLRLYSGQRTTVLATAATAMPTAVGSFPFVIMEAKVNSAAGYVRVWQDGALVIDYNADLSAIPSLDTVKVGGFYPTNLQLDDFYIANGFIGDPGDVTDLPLGP